MKINHFLQLIILFLCILWNNTANAAVLSTEEARHWAQNKGEEIIAILSSEQGENKQNRLENILNHDIDLAHAAKFVIGKYWKSMTDEQKERYNTIFREYLKSSYQSYNLEIKKDDISFKIEKVVKNNDQVDVFCTIILKNLEKKVDQESKGGISAVFVLVKNENTIQVRDLKIEESSLLISLRQRFYKMIHEDDDDEIDWFLDDLEASAKDNYQNNQNDF